MILSAGPVGSAHILLNSGVGPRAELLAAGVQPLVDSPGVGRGLWRGVTSEHSLRLVLASTATVPTSPYALEEHARQFLRGRGPLAGTGVDEVQVGQDRTLQLVAHQTGPRPRTPAISS